MKFVYYAMLVLRTVQLENVIPFDKKYIIDVIKYSQVRYLIHIEVWDKTRTWSCCLRRFDIPLWLLV